jgi:CSLREA domain-containing protein
VSPLTSAIVRLCVCGAAVFSFFVVDRRAVAQTIPNKPPGVTIITHGFQGPGAQTVPLWVNELANAILNRTSALTPIYTVRFDASTWRVTPLFGMSIDVVSNPGAIILLDWAQASNDLSADRRTEFVGDAFFEYLFGQSHNGRYLAELPIHLIGHSRGASVNSRLAFRLAQAGILVDQTTTLDPHPVEKPVAINDWEVVTYENTLFADNYYQNRWNSFLDGTQVPGAQNRHLDSAFSRHVRDCDGHEQTHAYYLGTIDLNAVIDSGGCLIWHDWYFFARGLLGFNTTRLLQGQSVRLEDAYLEGLHNQLVNSGGTGTREPVSSSGKFWPNAGFGPQASLPDRLGVGDTLWLKYFFSDRSSQQAVEFFLDNDTNPFNGYIERLGTPRTHAARPVTIGFAEFPWTPTSAGGPYFVGLKTTNRLTDIGFVRYDYVLQSFTVQANVATISSISPSRGLPQDGTKVVVKGAGFLSGATVRFGGINATSVSVVDSNTLTAITPAHAAGVVDVIVINRSGSSGTLSRGFTYTSSMSAVPTIISSAADQPTQTTARISVTVNPNGTAGTLFLDYGPTVNYGDVVSNSLTTTTSPLVMSQVLTSLQCDTIYHYRARAVNSVGSATPGEDNTFGTGPCASTAPGELLTNGAFTTVNSGWSAPGHFFYDSRVNVCRPGSCPGYAYLSQENRLAGDNLSGTLTQTITIPSAISSAELSFWYYIESVDTGTASDLLRVTLRSSSGSVLSTIATLSNLDRNTGYVRLSKNVLEHAGRRVTVHFEGTTNGSNPTIFRIDDVSLVVSASTAPPSSAPTAETGEASAFTDTTARLSAAINPNGSSTSVFFDYGVAGVGGNTNSAGSIGAGQSFVTATADLTGLSCGTRYFYRVRAVNDHGSRTGAQEEFRTTDCGYAIISVSGNLQFGDVPVGASVTSVMTITNEGSTPLDVNAWSIPFGFRRTTIPGTIPPRESRDVQITFAPSLLLSYSGTVVIDGPNAIRRNTLPISGTGVFTGTYLYTDVEADYGAWSAESPWGPIAKTGRNGTRGWTTGPYANNANARLGTFSIDLSTATQPQLKFWHRRAFADDGFDSGNVLVSADGGQTFTRVMSYFGANQMWREATVDLGAFTGQPSVRIYFQLLSDGTSTGDGWSLDDIAVIEADASDGSLTSRTFLVDSKLDGVDATPGDGVCSTAASLCTLRAAIQEANALPGAEVINVPAGTYALTISGKNENAAASGDLDVTESVTINGAGTASTIIDANAIDRVFEFRGSGGAYVVSSLTMRNGSTIGSTAGGCIALNAGSLTMPRVTITDCTAANAGGGIWINPSTIVTIVGSTIAGNSAPQGGGINSQGMTTIANSTISGNTATSSVGGAIFAHVAGVTSLKNVTISGNSSGSGAAVGVISPAQLDARNTIIASSAGAANSNCAGPISNLGNNLEFPGTTCGFTAADPLLGVLADNGGSTFTHALGAGSPALDAGDNATCAAGPVSGVDQRGASRPFDAQCDIGAVEGASNAAPTITTQPSDQAVNAGQTAQFQIAAVGTGLTYQWQMSTNSGGSWTNITNASPYSGATTTTLTVTSVTPELNEYQFRCLVTNPITVASTAAKLTVSAVAPTVTQNPASITVAAAATASFTATATGTPAPTVQWQVRSSAGGTFADIAGATSATHSITAAASDHGKQFRAVFVNSAGTATTLAATLTVPGILVATPTSLTFGATDTISGLQSVTSAQTVTVTFAGGASSWTATSSQTWLQLTGASGGAAGSFTAEVNVAAVPPGQTVLATITVTGGSGGPLVLPVTLAVKAATSSRAPFGVFDTPATGSTVAGSIPVSGWALDDVEVTRVEIWRDRAAGETTPVYSGSGLGNGKIYIADPVFVSGARPDVEAANPGVPLAHRAGWGYLLLTQGLFNQGNGQFTLYAFAFDKEGRSTVLGTKTITSNNAAATQPFGNIDTPSYGQTVSGSFWNFGWALTPNATPTCVINNGSVFMSIDSGTLVPVNYGDARTDIAAAFPGFSNGAGAGGAFYFDTTALTNGTHQIGWYIVDSCNRAEGVGSRFFTILNTSSTTETASVTAPVQAAAVTTPNVESADAIVVRRDNEETFVSPDARGDRVVPIGQSERIEVVLPARATSYAGYQVVNGERRALPLGSSFDTVRGVFYWQPAAGFLGAHDLEFVTTSSGVVRVRFIVETSIQAVIDTPQPGEVGPSFVVAGWAIDQAATKGTGIDTVHVWAYPTTGAPPIFLGEAPYGDRRPDIGALFGEQFAGAAYRIATDGLAPGSYDIVVYPHSSVTGDFQGATVVRVTVYD